MYAWDFPRKNGANNAIGPGKWVESLSRRHRGRFGNEASRSDRVRGVGVPETTEWSRSFGAVFVGAMCGGDYVVKIVSS